MSLCIIFNKMESFLCVIVTDFVSCCTGEEDNLVKYSRVISEILKEE